jgi:hypothetical protein
MNNAKQIIEMDKLDISQVSIGKLKPYANN